MVIMNILIEKLNKIKPQKIGKEPVVILSLEDFEKMREDLEMHESKILPAKISKARKEADEGKILTFDEVKKKLKLA